MHEPAAPAETRADTTAGASVEAGVSQADEEHARLRAVLSSMADAVLVVDPDGRPVLTSSAYDRIFGTGREIVAEDASGRPLSPEDRPDQRAARGESFTMSFTIAAPDGERRWFEANAQPIVRDGERHGAVVAIRDITERSVMQLQDEFMAIASHELRTPLTVLLGYLEMLHRRLVRDGDQALVRYASRALSQTKRLAELITNLLDVTRLQHGKMQVDLEPVDLVQLIGQTLEVARSLAEGQEIAFSAAEREIVTLADPGRLEQVVMNLLTNAIKYAPATQRIDVRLYADDGHAVIEVQDYGPGIPEADLPNLFSRFYQVQASRPRSSGLGLGLFISNEIVRAHGGTITASSSEGQGATFTVRLPRSEAAER